MLFANLTKVVKTYHELKTKFDVKYMSSNDSLILSSINNITRFQYIKRTYVIVKKKVKYNVDTTCACYV